jgi:hypothetical protein
MPTTAITVTETLGPYGNYAADAADFTPTAADAANGNHYVSDGTEIVVAENTDGAAAHTVTVTSQPDALGRTKDISAYSLGANEKAVFGPFAPLGWRNSSGQVLVSADSALVTFAVIRPKK